ncbi:PKD-like family lipoprotein [Sphingobacterium sp. Ag1]|uniref:PKD-like family lipoprotein n=1 Tax=Sphingobacterium sp. Ag1 TaxID=1643451 RepID=UPI0018CCE16E|nr:PKD-like family lipoprotein [Sphingobacterium sp. Ag1]
MKNISYSIISFLMACMFLGGCKKDLGNYNYSQINELDTITELPNEVTALVGKDLLLTPKIQFTQDSKFIEDNYQYQWTYIGPNGLGGQEIFSLSEEKNLNIKMNLVAGSYLAYFSVTDKQTGIKYTRPFKLKVVNEINEGWIMMNEANGKARVDMLVLNSNNTFDLYNDVLAYTGSELKLTGKPVMTYTYSTGLLLGPDKISYGLYFGTTTGTTKVDPNTFKWTKTMGLSYEMIGTIPDGFYADVIQQRNGSSSYLIGGGNAYFYDRALNIFYSSPINYIAAEEKSFEVAPFIGGRHTDVSNPVTLYDKTNRRFVRHVSTASTCTTLIDPDKDLKLFSFKTGLDMVYMRWMAYNGGEIFAILKEPNGSKKYLARFNAVSTAQTYYNEITGTDIDKAEFFAFNPEFGYLFYSAGGKIYEYDMTYKTSKLMVDLGDKKVSYLNFYEFKNSTKYTSGNKLMVGFYDPNKADGTEGSLNIYTVPGLNANIVLDKSYTGFGRLKNLTYRER